MRHTNRSVNGGGLDLEALAGTHLVVMKFTFRVEDPDVVAVFIDPVPGAVVMGQRDGVVASSE